MPLLEIFSNDLANGLFQNFAMAVMKIFYAILIIVIGVFVAKILRKLVYQFLQKTGLDKLADHLTKIEIIDKMDIEILPSKIVSGALYYLIIFLCVIAASDALNMPAISHIVTNFFDYLPSLVSAFIIFIAGTFFADWVKNIVFITAKSLGIPSAKMIANLIFYFLFLTFVISALSQARINTTFITSNINIILGGIALAFAIGYGLASKDLMANLVASFYLKNKYKVGDHIGLFNQDGIIIEMDNASFTLQTQNGKKVYPLSSLLKEEVTIHDQKMLNQ